MIEAVNRELGEDCGVVAVYRPGGSAGELVHRALFALQHRGQEAAGIAAWSTDEIAHLKGRGLVSESLPTYQVAKLDGELAIGHNRYSTVTVDHTENIQPFLANTPYGPLAIAHNGNLKNAASLSETLKSEGALLSTTMDTELMVHLVARSGAPDFEGALRNALGKALGAWSLTLLVNGKLYGARDANGVRPLVIGKLPNNGWVVASETTALLAIGAEYVREVECGELVEIGPDGLRSIQLIDEVKPAPCVFELVYFARPNSEVFGHSVHRSRVLMGEELAAQDEEDERRPDVVVPVPDSGFPAGIGYAKRSGIPLEQGIIRSHYVGRTFILPDQDSRSHSINLKLSAIPHVVEGKRVALIDDSIVRGNTSRLIVQMVRDAGAKEVWMRIASPPLSWPCYLGINTPSREELAINQYETVDGIRAAIGAEDLRYLNLDRLKRAVGGDRYCFGCMTGHYPV